MTQSPTEPPKVRTQPTPAAGAGRWPPAPQSETAAPAAADDDTQAAATRPFNLRPYIILLSIVLVAAVAYFARPIVVPTVAALLLTFLFRPLVRRLHRWQIPEAISAGLIVLGLALLIVGPVFVLRQPVAEWLESMPAHLREIEWKLRGLEGSVEEVGEVAQAIDEATGAKEGVETSTLHSSRILATVLSQTGATIVMFTITLALTFFLLSAGEQLKRSLVGQLSRRSDKREALQAIQTIEQDVSQYLLTLTLINVVLATVTAVVLWLLGMSNPIVWGVSAGLFNYIPYLGPIVYIVLLAIGALLHYDTLGWALLPPLAFFCINFLEAYIIGPMVYGRRLTLNPIMVFMALVILGWIWGVVGALMAVPLLVCTRIICSHVASLQGVCAVICGDDSAIRNAKPVNSSG